jgi:hypothetical protein
LTVTTDAQGNASFSVALSSTTVAGQIITATVTDQVNGDVAVEQRRDRPGATPVGVDIRGQPSDTMVGRAIAPVVNVLVVDIPRPYRSSHSHPWVKISVLSGPAAEPSPGSARSSPGLTAGISNVFTVAPRR